MDWIIYLLNRALKNIDLCLEGGRALITELGYIRNASSVSSSRYLDRLLLPLALLPLAVVLPRMLEKVGVELTTAGPVEARRLRQRAQVILDLLTPQVQSSIPS